MKKEHPEVHKKIRSVLKVKAEKYPVKEEEYQLDFPASYNEIKEGERKLDGLKVPECMNAGIKTVEVHISNDGRPKMAKIGDYWSEKHTREIIDLLKEYQDVFTRDNKDPFYR